MNDQSNLAYQNMLAKQAEDARRDAEARQQQQHFETLNRIDQFQVDQQNKKNNGG